ncbi:MAG: hypothetical protein ACFHU9_05445 [Fluviicola sp.]
MIAEKRHIGLLVYDDDRKKTPVANMRTEALGWWDTISEEAKKQVLSEHGFSSEIAESLGWSDLVSVYRSVHHRSDAERWWDRLSNAKQQQFLYTFRKSINDQSKARWVKLVQIFLRIHNIVQS